MPIFTGWYADQKQKQRTNPLAEALSKQQGRGSPFAGYNAPAQQQQYALANPAAQSLPTGQTNQTNVGPQGPNNAAPSPTQIPGGAKFNEAIWNGNIASFPENGEANLYRGIGADATPVFIHPKQSSYTEADRQYSIQQGFTDAEGRKRDGRADYESAQKENTENLLAKSLAAQNETWGRINEKVSKRSEANRLAEELERSQPRLPPADSPPSTDFIEQQHPGYKNALAIINDPSNSNESSAKWQAYYDSVRGSPFFTFVLGPLTQKIAEAKAREQQAV